jgi:hypothetical protein
VNESALVGLELFQFTATDGDLAGTNNARFDFSIASGNGDRAFALSPEGLLVLNSALDYETRPECVTCAPGLRRNLSLSPLPYL